MPADPDEYYARTYADSRPAGDPDDYADEDPAVLRLMRASGGVVIPKADVELGIPSGQDPEDVRGVQIVVDPSAEDGQTYRYRFDGKGDAVLSEVAARHATAFRQAHGQDKMAAAVAAMAEVAAVKASRAADRRALQGMAPREPQPRAAAAPEAITGGRPPVRVTFDLGPAVGSQTALYADAVVHGDVLVLVADASTTYYTPPVLGPDRTISVGVEGLPAPVRAFSPGFCFPRGGEFYCVLPIDRAE